MNKDLVQEAGLTVRSAGEGPKPAQQTTKGEIAEPSKYTQMLAIWGELIELAVLTDNRRKVPINVRKREVARRFVRDTRNPESPLVVKAMIYAENVTRFDKETKKHVPVPGVGLGYKADVQVPIDGKMETVKAVPHILVDGAGGLIQYGTFEKSGDAIVVNAREHFCMVLFPIKRGHPFRLIPLGLASASRIDMWNRVATGLPGRNLPTIEQIPHNLFANEGARYLVYTPPGMWAFEPKKDNEEDGEIKFSYNYGHICGQTARVIARGGFPPYDDEEMCTFSELRVFLVELGERSIGLQYVGRKGQVRLLQGTIDLGGGGLNVNPFEALGVSVLTAHPQKHSRAVFEMASKGALNVQNPLYAYAVKIGLIDPVQVENAQFVRASLNRLAAIVTLTLRDQLEEIKSSVVAQLCMDKLPSSVEVLSDKSAEEVFHRNGGEDFLASWINERIEGNFDWNSWVHRGVRLELLGRVGIKGVERPLATEPVVTQTTEVHQAHVADPPKKVRKPRAPKAAKA